MKETITEIITMLKSFPVIKYYGEDASYCRELNLVYTLNSGYLIQKQNQYFKSLGGVYMNNHTNKIISKNGLKCDNINMSKSELLWLLSDLKELYIKIHVL